MLSGAAHANPMPDRLSLLFVFDRQDNLEKMYLHPRGSTFVGPTTALGVYYHHPCQIGTEDTVSSLCTSML